MLQSPFDVQRAFEASAVDVAITYLDTRLRRNYRAHVLYTEQYDLLVQKGTIFFGRRWVAWEDLTKVSLCLLSPDSPIFGKAESEILAEILTKTPHIVTNAIWMVMDHVRSGKWASVLPRPVRIMASDDPELEAIPLPSIGKASSVGIAISKRGPVSPLAEAFFEMATSGPTAARLRTVLGMDRSALGQSTLLLGKLESRRGRSGNGNAGARGLNVSADRVESVSDHGTGYTVARSRHRR